MMGFFNRLTVLDVLNRELERLHIELDAYTFDDEKDNTDSMAGYKLVLAQVETLNKHLIELSKEKPKY